MIREVLTVVAQCDVCGVHSAPYKIFAGEDATFKLPEGTGWNWGKRWNRSWSALLVRHYCSTVCAESEEHGLKRKNERPADLRSGERGNEENGETADQS